MKDKILNILKTVGKSIVYPPNAMISYFLLISMISIKMIATEKAKLFSILFQHYFLQIQKAKKEKRKAEVEINFAEIGAVIEYLKSTLKLTFTIVILLYLVLGFFITTAISGILIFLHVPFEYVIAIQVPVSIIAIIYYLGLSIYLIAKEITTTEVNQDFLKQQIFYETAYIYQKSCEIDKEVADMTMYHLSTSLMLDNEKTKTDKELKQIIGVEK